MLELKNIKISHSPSKATKWRRNKRAVVALEVEAELEAMAANFEEAGPDASWTGKEIAHAVRERIKFRKVSRG
jgi:diphthamide synthase (EF-2-diphthine--ammonia ligase)